MKILVVNSGSSSLKFQLIDMDTNDVLSKGVVDRIGDAAACIKGSFRDGVKLENIESIKDHVVAIKLLLEYLVDDKIGVIESINEIGAVGHRIVHSGGFFDDSVLVADDVLEKLKETFDIAELHNPPATLGLLACQSVMKDVPMVLVFDTGFHATMPPKAYMYGIDYADYEKFKVRKYGFHGTSHKYVSKVAVEVLKKDAKDLKIVTCHLGNGASIAAVDGGICVDTSMGFTPLEGLVMGTRCGDMDLAALEFLCKKKGLTHAQGREYANKLCGVKGICGYSDFRDVIANARIGDEKSQLALDVFCYRVKKYIGAYAFAMGGLDVIVFTAGIGEHNALVREMICDGLENFGVEMDKQANENAKSDVAFLCKPNSKVALIKIATNEELVIAQETQRVINK